MASSKANQHQPPSYHHHLIPLHLHQSCRNLLVSAFLLLAAAFFFLWPSNPDLKITHLHLESIDIQTIPIISVDITLGLTIKVRNVDFYAIDYSSIMVSIGYRGKKLGYFVTLDEGHVRARGSEYADATLELNGVEVISDVILFLKDLARGSVPFDTITEVAGKFEFLFYNVPLKVNCFTFHVLCPTSSYVLKRASCEAARDLVVLSAYHFL
ncbi:hypothetical protein TEA_017301 [Camellia sinensis var. sinensis]|uniref:Late embryogenesis abundant protein LEA-2 subgroup domain-containing protein n=1 Tax=Camellia sinensis var. sinensis TaxID=542762 RepID=A0A4S4DLM2_CAMSN|nr:hypothetical protein TEA_017301 [Camellia sinensis var. sinensis]